MAKPTVTSSHTTCGCGIPGRAALRIIAEVRRGSGRTAMRSRVLIYLCGEHIPERITLDVVQGMLRFDDHKDWRVTAVVTKRLWRGVPVT